jgi:hypothetical protein
MKKIKFNKISIVVLAIAFTLGLGGIVAVRAFTNPASVTLGTASNFAVLAGSGITDTNPSVIVGNAGSNPTVSNGLTGVEVTGTNYTASDAAVIAAKVASATTYGDISTRPQSGVDIPTDLAAQNLTAGIYHSAAGTFGISGAGTLTLDGGGNPNSVFIFKADTTLITGGASSVVLTNGAQACNVFWAVGTSATLNNTTFVGTIMAQASITDTGTSTVVGRLLADAENNGTGAVTLNNTHVTVPTCVPHLTLVKTINNTGGGTALNTAWTLTATGTGSPTNLSGITGATGADSDLAFPNATFKADTYTLAETGPSGYTASLYSCVKNGGSAVFGNSIILARGDVATCTITNTFGTSTAAVVATSSNSGGGTVYGCTDPSATNYISNYVSSNPALCIYGGVSPLIHVTKVPSPLALLAGPGVVTYTEKVTNPGVAALSNIILTDDKCSPLNYISGDLNNDSKLDTTETWTYTCQTNLTKTTTNTARVQGTVNGLIAKDFAIVTVVVSTPGLPKTGFPPRGEGMMWYVIASAGILVSLFSFYLVKNKKTI